MKGKDFSLKIFGGGQIVAIAPTADKAKDAFEDGAKALLRSQMCTGCGICVKSCRPHAIRIDNGIIIDERKCNNCGKCSEICVVAHYYDKLVS